MALTQSEINKAAKKLASIYHLTDTNPRAINPIDKERLYALAGQNPEIHYAALAINNKRDKGR